MKKLRNLKKFLMQLAMLTRIIGLFFNDQWTALIDSVPPMKTARDQLKLMVDGLQAKLDEYKKIITWVASQKKQARITLAETSFPIMSRALAWAIKNNNEQAASNLNYSVGDMIKMGFQTLLTRVSIAKNIVEPNLEDLLPYGITPEMFQDWQTKYNDLAAYQNNGPKSAINERKRIGGELLTDMKAAMNLFHSQIIPLMGGFYNTPSFYNQFRLDSIIGSANVHHTRLLAHCTDELGNPVYGLTVTVDQFTDPDTGKIYAADSAITDPNGNAEVIEFFAGNRTVTLSGPNIETTTFPAMQFEKGKAITHIFIVQPSFNIPAPQENQTKENA